MIFVPIKFDEDLAIFFDFPKWKERRYKKKERKKIINL